VSLADYRYSLTIGQDDDVYYGLIMAAMRGADTDNLEKLRREWPHVYDELVARCHAPAGLLPGEYDQKAGLHRREDGTLEEIGPRGVLAQEVRDVP